MKIAEYNQMMKYLTRPAERPVFKTSDPKEAIKEIIKRTEGQLPGIRVAPGINFNPLGTVEDQDPSLTGKFGVGGGELEFGVKEDEGFIGFRKEFEEGGVIGEDGMFEGEDLGTREGFAEIKTKGIIKTSELAELLRKTGLTVSDKNLSRLAEVYEIKRPNKVQVAYKDKGSTRIVDIKKPTQFYIKPTASQLKQIKKQYDINQLKAPGTTEAGQKAFQERKDYITKLLKSKKYTQAEVQRMAKAKFNKDMTTAVSNVAKTIKGVPSGVGESAPLTKKVKSDLTKLNKSEVKRLLKTGDANLEKLVNKTSKLLNVDKNLATRRIGQLIEAYAGDDRYLKVEDDLLLRRVQPLLKGLGNIEGTKLFGGLPGGLQRVRAERGVAKDLGKPSSFFPSLRKRIQELIPGSGYETDEIKNIKSSFNFKTSPYSMFIQGVRSDINQEKAATLDKQTSIYEKRLQNAKTITEKKKIANEFNKKAKAFVAEQNKNLKPGQLPVRALEISFKKPNEVIKNKSALSNYGDMFDDIYKKHGYSFKVPSDVKTVDEILPFLKGGRGQKQVLRGVQTQAPRLFAQAVPGAKSVGDFTQRIIDEVAKGKIASPALKTLGLAGVGYGIYDTGVGFKEGVSVPELGTRFFGLDPVYRYAQEQMSLSPEARKIQRAINRNIAAEAEDVAGLGMLDLQPAKEVTEEEKQILETELEKIRQNRETLNQQRAQERADLLRIIQDKINNPGATVYRSEFSAGGIAALKALLNFLGKARGKKGSELLQEVNPKKYGTVIENLMLPDDKKMVGGFRVEYLESLLDTIKTDKAMLDRMKKMPADQQESFFNMINQGANQGRLDVYKKINPDEAILEIEQMIKNLKTKDMSPEEIKRSLNAYGGRIGFDEGGPGDPSRRKFFKIMGGLASLPILGKIAKPIAKIGPEATEVVSRTAEQMPVYLTTLINKIKSIGKSKLIGKPDNPEGFVQYDLEDYTLIEGPGYTRVSKTEYGASSQGEGIKNQLEVEIKKDPETGAIEYDEFTVSPDAEGKLKDVDFGIEDVDHKTMETFANE